MKDSQEKLAKEDSAIVALLTCSTIREAAEKCGQSESTLYRWLNDEEFNNRYQEAKKRAFEAALGLIQGATSDAVKRLKENLTCGKPSDENRAAIALLDYAFKVVEVRQLEERLAALERMLGEK